MRNQKIVHLEKEERFLNFQSANSNEINQLASITEIYQSLFKNYFEKTESPSCLKLKIILQMFTKLHEKNSDICLQRSLLSIKFQAFGQNLNSN